MTAAREPAKPIVFTGLRGMGKTALLRRVVRDARSAGGIVILGEADGSLRFADVMRRQLTEALAASESLPKRVASAMQNAIARLPKLSYELPNDGGSVTVDGSTEAERASPGPDDSLEDTLLVLNEQLHRHERFLAIGLDELQESPPRDLLRIIRVVHETAGTDRPILFVGAGLPDSAAVLKSARTYTERWAFYRLELLSLLETYEAVDIPARALGVVWEPDAVELVYEKSHGYPYFIQEFASAAWLRRVGATIAESDIVSVSLGVQRMLDESVYDRQFGDLSPREAAFVLALHELGGGAHAPDDIARALGARSSADLSSTRTSLLRKDVIYAPGRGLIEFRIPLTNEYVARRHEDLKRRAARATPPRS